MTTAVALFGCYDLAMTKDRVTSIALAMAVAVVGLVIIVKAAQAEDAPSYTVTTVNGRTVWTSSAIYTAKPEVCRDSQRAISFYRQKYRIHREKMRLRGPVPRVWYRDCAVVRRRAVEWRDRAEGARIELIEWVAYHYDWRSWLPDNWYRVGSCETGYGGDPNWHHSNSRFVSAFGISRSIYGRDAAVYGVPPWNDSRPPTPREQYLAALGHYKLFGDGWTCPGP